MSYHGNDARNKQKKSSDDAKTSTVIITVNSKKSRTFPILYRTVKTFFPEPANI